MGSKYGKIGKKLTHQRCRRCGRRSYNLRKGYCAACGYGASKKLKGNSWKRRNVQRLRIR